MALQEVIDILGYTRCIRIVLTHTLPESKKDVCRILVLKQEIDFIIENESVSAFGTIGCNAI